MGEEGAAAAGQGQAPRQQRAGTAGGGGWRAGGRYMMEQADSGFRTWQVQAAPQYCRKLW